MEDERKIEKRKKSQRGFGNCLEKSRKISFKTQLSKLKIIWEEKNFGPNMAIDEKHINGEFFSILSNRDTGKVAAIIRSVKGKWLKKCLYDLPRKIRWNVKSLSRDLSQTFADVGNEIFMNAVHVADKFHILKMGFEALQSVRIRYRQEILAEERVRYEIFRCQEAERRNLCKKNQEKFVAKIFPKSPIYSNGDTQKQLLARSRFLLYKFESEWNSEQRKRAKILFRCFPDIEKSYKLMCHFRAFYAIKPQHNIPKAREALRVWFQRVGGVEISEIQNFASSVFRHKEEILSFFEKGDTNALAESINSKIQRFSVSNFGTRDSNFFFFRLKNLLC